MSAVSAVPLAPVQSWGSVYGVNGVDDDMKIKLPPQLTPKEYEILKPVLEALLSEKEGKNNLDSLYMPVGKDNEYQLISCISTISNNKKMGQETLWVPYIVQRIDLDKLRELPLAFIKILMLLFNIPESILDPRLLGGSFLIKRPNIHIEPFVIRKTPELVLLLTTLQITIKTVKGVECEDIYMVSL